jgi:hypothetical protein
MRPQTLFLTGLVLGALMGLAFVVGGTLTLIPGMFIWAWVIARRPRFVGASGGLIGFGASWVLLIGQAGWRCSNDASCSMPDLSPWFGLAAVMVAAGLALGLASVRRLRSA